MEEGKKGIEVYVVVHKETREIWTSPPMISWDKPEIAMMAWSHESGVPFTSQSQYVVEKRLLNI